MTAIDEDGLEHATIHRALIRPELYQFFGCDREMIMFAGLASGTCIFIGMTWVTALYGVALWIVSLTALRFMAKKDSRLRDVYLRYRRYQKFYPAKSTPRVKHGQFQVLRMRDPWKK
jgi:type IV secretion system protein VirB3